MPELSQLPTINGKSQVDEHVGELVAIEGVVSNTKIPTILGVDVSSDSPDLRGERAAAVGVLHKWTVTQEELDAQIAERGVFAHRGPGTYYRLVDPETGATAQVQALKHDNG